MDFNFKDAQFIKIDLDTYNIWISIVLVISFTVTFCYCKDALLLLFHVDVLF